MVLLVRSRRCRGLTEWRVASTCRGYCLAKRPKYNSTTATYTFRSELVRLLRSLRCCGHLLRLLGTQILQFEAFGSGHGDAIVNLDAFLTELMSFNPTRFGSFTVLLRNKATL